MGAICNLRGETVSADLFVQALRRQLRLACDRLRELDGDSTLVRDAEWLLDDDDETANNLERLAADPDAMTADSDADEAPNASADDASPHDDEVMVAKAVLKLLQSHRLDEFGREHVLGQVREHLEGKGGDDA